MTLYPSTGTFRHSPSLKSILAEWRLMGKYFLLVTNEPLIYLQRGDPCEISDSRRKINGVVSRSTFLTVHVGFHAINILKLHQVKRHRQKSKITESLLPASLLQVSSTNRWSRVSFCQERINPLLVLLVSLLTFFFAENYNSWGKLDIWRKSVIVVILFFIFQVYLPQRFNATNKKRRLSLFLV